VRIGIEWDHSILMRTDRGGRHDPPRRRAKACVALERGLIV